MSEGNEGLTGKDVEFVLEALKKANVPLKDGDRVLSLTERVLFLADQLVNTTSLLQDAIEENESNECFMKDTKADCDALLNLSEELTKMGFREIDPSSTRAAVIMLQSMRERLRGLDGFTLKMMNELGIPTSDHETVESRLRRFAEILHLIDFRGIQKVIDRKEGAGK